MTCEVMQVINLRRPGLAAVQKIMGWIPLHLQQRRAKCGSWRA